MTTTETNEQITHDTFRIERIFRASRERAFGAWADINQKAKWFVGPTGWVPIERELDFKVGGSEVAIGRFNDAFTTRFYATYQDIVPLERIVYSYRMFMDDTMLSVSLATIEFQENGSGSKIIFTEQGAFFGDPEGAAHRRKGSNILMDQLAQSVDGD